MEKEGGHLPAGCRYKQLALLVLLVQALLCVGGVAKRVEGVCGVLASHFPVSTAVPYIAPVLAQSLRVWNTSRITSVTSSFFTVVNGSKLQSIAVHYDDTAKRSPGRPLADATFAVADVSFASVGAEGQRLTFNTTRPEGIRLAPGLYWLVVTLSYDSLGWVLKTHHQQDPRLPINITADIAEGPGPEWELMDQMYSAVLGFDGCVETDPPAQHQHGDDAGTTVGIVLGVIATLGLFAAAGVALALWFRRRRNRVSYASIAEPDNNYEL